tara:strand:- start:781 stop:1179 length:399 start_codon:yes stop_codon:yes gene_type:complete
MAVAITALRQTIADALANAGVWQTFSFPPATIMANSVIVAPADPYIVPANGHFNQAAIRPQANFKIIMTEVAYDNQGNLAAIEDTMIAVFNKLANSAIVFSVTAISAPTILDAASGSLLMAELSITVLTTWS